MKTGVELIPEQIVDAVLGDRFIITDVIGSGSTD